MIALILLGFVTFFIANELRIAIYNLYFHPLRSFPGPKSWIAFPVLRYIEACRGTFDEQMVKLHIRYGEVVRFSNDSLSFTTAQAWNDIYGYGHGQTQWPKVEFRDPSAPQTILFSDDVHHARFRKALSVAFSDKSLGLQERLVKEYIDSLIVGLRDEADHGRDVDMTMWYNLTTFDIISDLAFGESSNCLKNRIYPEYIVIMFKFVRIVPFVLLARFYPAFWRLIRILMGDRINKSRNAMNQIGIDALKRRQADRSKEGRGDFMEALLQYSEQKEPINDDQLAAHGSILFLAGSETAATLLAGVTYWMLNTPETLRRATEEVRSTFEREEDISFASTSTRLPYLRACLEEGLRKYPPIPTIMQRTVPKDAVVSGYAVPAGAIVGVHHLSASNIPANFADAGNFHPERWLPEATKNPDSPFYKDERGARQPFSVGPRNCIGKTLAYSEMRQILARVLWNFDIELVEQNKDDPWTNQKIMALWSKKPLMCRLTARKV